MISLRIDGWHWTEIDSTPPWPNFTFCELFSKSRQCVYQLELDLISLSGHFSSALGANNDQISLLWTCASEFGQFCSTFHVYGGGASNNQVWLLWGEWVLFKTTPTRPNSRLVNLSCALWTNNGKNRISLRLGEWFWGMFELIWTWYIFNFSQLVVWLGQIMTKYEFLEAGDFDQCSKPLQHILI